MEDLDLLCRDYVLCRAVEIRLFLRLLLRLVAFFFSCKGHLIDMRRETEQTAEIGGGEHGALYYILFSAGISHPRLLRCVAVVLDGGLLLYREDCALMPGRFMVDNS